MNLAMDYAVRHGILRQNPLPKGKGSLRQRELPRLPLQPPRPPEPFRCRLHRL